MGGPKRAMKPKIGKPWIANLLAGAGGLLAASIWVLAV